MSFDSFGTIYTDEEVIVAQSMAIEKRVWVMWPAFLAEARATPRNPYLGKPSGTIYGDADYYDEAEIAVAKIIAAGHGQPEKTCKEEPGRLVPYLRDAREAIEAYWKVAKVA